MEKHCILGCYVDVRLSLSKEELKSQRKAESLGTTEVPQEQIAKRYFKDSMLEDPWRHCKPVQVKKLISVNNFYEKLTPTLSGF